MYSLEQTWGRDTGIMEPGGKWCYCNYKRVAVMVSKNTIRYRCPVTHIPTKDNVKVSMDIGINFHIGKPELMIARQTMMTSKSSFITLVQTDWKNCFLKKSMKKSELSLNTLKSQE